MTRRDAGSQILLESALMTTLGDNKRQRQRRMNDTDNAFVKAEKETIKRIELESEVRELNDEVSATKAALLNSYRKNAALETILMKLAEKWGPAAGKTKEDTYKEYIDEVKTEFNEAGKSSKYQNYLKEEADKAVNSKRKITPKVRIRKF